MSDYLTFKPPVTHLDSAPCGSYDAYGKGEDRDYIVLVSDIEAAQEELADVGYVTAAYAYGTTGFRSLRSGNINIILTSDEARFTSFKYAALAMRNLADIIPLANKPFRIALYDLVRQTYAGVR
jgi:hypothetical protein